MHEKLQHLSLSENNAVWLTGTILLLKKQFHEHVSAEQQEERSYNLMKEEVSLLTRGFSFALVAGVREETRYGGSYHFVT